MEDSKDFFENCNHYKEIEITKTFSADLHIGYFLNYKERNAVLNLQENLKNYAEKLKTKYSESPSLLHEDKCVSVAAYVPKGKFWARGYLLNRCYDGSFGIFLMDYGEKDTVPAKAVLNLPPFGKEDKLPAQFLKIVLYGVIPIFLELNIEKEQQLQDAEYWNPKDFKYVKELLYNAKKKYFRELCEVDGFKFGYLYIVPAGEEEGYFLHKRLIDKQYAREDVNFEERIPSVIKKFWKFPRLRSEKHLWLTSSYSKECERKDRIITGVLNDCAKRELKSHELASFDFNNSDSLLDEEVNDGSSSSGTLKKSSSYLDAYSEFSSSLESVYSMGTRESKVSYSNDNLSAVEEDESTKSPSSLTSYVSDRGKLRLQFLRNRYKTHSGYSNLIADKEYEDPNVNKILVVSQNEKPIFKPAYSLKDQPIDGGTYETLYSNIRIRDLTVCQQHMIPAALTRKNVTLIDAPKCGKTSAYLIALVTMLKDAEFYRKIPIGVGPRAIILCPYSTHCESIYQKCLQLVKNVKSAQIDDDIYVDLKINIAYGCGKNLETQKSIDLTQGFDILVCTPSCVLRLLQQKELFNFDRVCHIVFDEMHILMESFFSETMKIVYMVESLRKLRKNPITIPQRIIISNYWFPKIKQHVDEDILSGGCLLISSYFEAVIYAGCDNTLQFFIKQTKKIDHINEFLNNEASGKSVVIVFNEACDLNEFHDTMKVDSKRRIICVTQLNYLFKEAVNLWKREAGNNKYPVMLCTDYTLSELGIHEADCLIHYNLPGTVNEFSFRFSVLLRSLSKVTSNEFMKNKDTTDTRTSKPEFHIYLDKESSIQYTRITELMPRLRHIVPDNVKRIAQELQICKERNKMNSEFCLHLKQFGRCINEKRCENRHVLIKEKDQPDDNIPKSGYVKFEIREVYNATHFCVRLLEHKNNKNDDWVQLKYFPHPNVVDRKLGLYFASADNRRIHISKTSGELAALEIWQDVFKRVKIIKFTEIQTRYSKTSDTKVDVPTRALVKLIDVGEFRDVMTSELLELSEELVTIPCSSLDAFICNLLPVDEDITWGEVISKKIENEIHDLKKNISNFFVGEIKLIINRDVWLHPFECRQWIGKNCVSKFSIHRALLKEQMALPNENHLISLIEKCELAELPIPVDFNEIAPASNDLSLNSSSCSANLEASEQIEKLIEEENVIILNGNEEIKSNGDSVNDEKNFDVNVTIEDAAVLLRKAFSNKMKKIRIKETVKLKPIVEWRQDASFIYLFIMVNTEKYTVEHTSDTLYFRGCIDEQEYEFNVKLFACIETSAFQCYKSGVTIYVKMKKLIKKNKWKRLLKSREPQQHWIRPNRNVITDSSENLTAEEDLILKPEDYERLRPELDYNPPARNDCVIHPAGYESRTISDNESEDDGDGYRRYYED